MTRFAHDHIHLRSPDPEKTADYYVKMFEAERITQDYSDGEKRIAFKLCGINFFVAPVRTQKVAPAPESPNLGIDHISLAVENVDAAAEELRQKGAEFSMEPSTLRPGVRVAFIRGPENVCIEIINRKFS